jgi:hypothetical protein
LELEEIEILQPDLGAKPELIKLPKIRENWIFFYNQQADFINKRVLGFFQVFAIGFW